MSRSKLLTVLRFHPTEHNTLSISHWSVLSAIVPSHSTRQSSPDHSTRQSSPDHSSPDHSTQSPTDGHSLSLRAPRRPSVVSQRHARLGRPTGPSPAGAVCPSAGIDVSCGSGGRQGRGRALSAPGSAQTSGPPGLLGTALSHH